MNFDLLQLGPTYQSQLEWAFNYADPMTWCDNFNDWEQMSLLEGIQHGEHYKLISQSNWTKLKQLFGGGPEIPFFQYQVETVITNPDGTKEVKKESKHDFDPIRVKVHILKRNSKE